MNRRNAAALQGMLSELHPAGEVSVTAEPDGATLVISGEWNGCGADGSHSGTDAKFRMSDGGTLMRFLLNGHLD
jgi:hypothetical protein